MNFGGGVTYIQLKRGGTAYHTQHPRKAPPSPAHQPDPCELWRQPQCLCVWSLRFPMMISSLTSLDPDNTSRERTDIGNTVETWVWSLSLCGYFSCGAEQPSTEEEACLGVFGPPWATSRDASILPHLLTLTTKMLFLFALWFILFLLCEFPSPSFLLSSPVQWIRNSSSGALAWSYVWARGVP